MRLSKALLVTLEVALAALCTASVALLYARYYVDLRYLPVLLGAVAGGVLVAVLTGRLRAEVAALAGVLGFALLAVFAVYTPTLRYAMPTGTTFTELGGGLLHGWARMLTVNLPADTAPTLLITPVLLGWTAALLAVRLILRSRARFAPTIPPLVAFLAGLLLTAARPVGGLLVTGAFVAGLLLLTVVRVVRLELATADTESAKEAARGVAGRIAFSAPAVLLVAALGAAGAWLIPVAHGTHRFDPRTVVPLQLDVNDALTPLATIKSQLREPQPRALFTVRVDGKLDRIRTAALDQFDGALWTSGDTFLVAGRSLAADPKIARPQRVTLDVTVEGLTGPYLPAAGWPVGVDGTGIGFSAASGVLVSNAEPLRGTTYRVVGELRAPDGGLTNAMPVSPHDDGHYATLPPGAPADIVQQSQRLTSRAVEPYAKLKAIQDYLHSLPYNLDSRPGHSYDAVRRLFSANPQDRVGYAEQYASAFAVLARAQNYPVRVATGYLLRPERRSAGGSYAVTTADAHAWAEVYFDGYGWVPFEPTDFAARPGVQQSQPPPDAGPANRPADADNAGTDPVVDPGLTGGPTTRQRVIEGALITLVVVVALMILLPALVVLEKLRRRRRRRSGSPAQRVIGAWRDSTDRLIERGVQVVDSDTPIEIAAAAAATPHIGARADALAALAPLATAAIYAKEPPEPETVREAWQHHRQLRRDLGRKRAAGTVAAWLDPRPLVAVRGQRRRRRKVLTDLRNP